MNIYYARERLRTGSIFDLKLKVAYYARVSTEKVEQQVSIKHQQEYYEEFIRSNQNWTFREHILTMEYLESMPKRERNFRI